MLIDIHIMQEKLEDLALFLSTSGSTGESKHVRISYNNLYSNTKSLVSTLGIKHNDKDITSLPN